MTAKELKEKAKGLCRDRLASPDDYWFNYDELQTFIEQLCKEQRELCGEEVSIPNTPTKSRVRNAPMPEL